MHPLAIIGIDPGTTSAYAVLGLDGKVLRLHSGKELTLSEMITEIISVSQPIITATDKARIPSFVEEFGRKMGTSLIAPEEDLQREEKRELLRHSSLQEYPENDHQSDSLSAALFAHRKYLPKLERIDRFIRDHHLEHRRREFTRMALATEFHFAHIHRILTDAAPEHCIMERVIATQTITKKDFTAVYQKLLQQKEQNTILERQVQELQEALTKLRTINRGLEKKSSSIGGKLEQLFRFKEDRLKVNSEQLRQQERNIHLLRKKIRSLFSFMGRTPSYRLVKKCATLSQKEFQEKKQLLSITKNDILFVENPDIYSERVIDEIKDLNVTLLTPQKVGKGIRVRVSAGVLTPDLKEDENEHFILVTPEHLDKITASEDILEKVITEYREKRRKGKD